MTYLNCVFLFLQSQESTALDELIGQLLASFQISEASQLTAEFGHFNQDLAIVVVNKPGLTLHDFNLTTTCNGPSQSQHRF